MEGLFVGGALLVLNLLLLAQVARAARNEAEIERLRDRLESLAREVQELQLETFSFFEPPSRRCSGAGDN